MAPAKAVIAANGTGLAGAASAYVRRVRIDDGTGQDERVVPVVEADEVEIDLSCEHAPFLAPAGECDVCDSLR
jgi:hypothetical protein